MTQFIIRRLIQAIPTFFGITFLSYMIIVAAPGDPVSIMTFDPRMKPETKAILASRYGLDDAWPVQYIKWLIGDDYLRVDTDGDGEKDSWGDRYGILRGDFGNSFRFKQNPLNLIFERLPATFELNIAVLFVTISIGVPLGVLAAIWRGTTFDQSSRVMAVVGDAVPVFWLGFLFILFFGSELEWLPLGNRCPPVRGGCPPIYQRLDYLLMPAIVSSFGGIAFWSRYMRASMLETIGSDYIRTARAKGLPGRNVWFRHGLRNAVIPMATFLGPTFAALLSGSVIIETVFAWPGVGKFLISAITSQDYPVIMASTVVFSILTILGYLLSDILYGIFDPRIRY